MSLSHPNLFSTKMMRLDKDLFNVSKDSNMNSYSRSCSWNLRKQPVILTDKEKEKIDKEHPGSYDKAIKYGSDPKKQYWYICPRYWSIKDNVSLTEEDVKSKKYGNVIPYNETHVPKDGNIFEFVEPNDHFRDNKYVNHNPGFLQNTCMPCCYRSVETTMHKERINKCNQKMVINPESNIPSIKESTEVTLFSTKLAESYIMSPESFPLNPNQFGYLPISIQNFIKTNNTQCYVSATNTKLKPKYKCLVRHGVESHKTQSFVGCISDIIGRSNNTTPISILKMKELFIKSLNLDIFMSLQNGNLIDFFYKNESNDINFEEHKATNIYKIVYKNKTSEQLNFLKKLCIAYNNFKLYLRDNTIEINYTYLWDLICRPNKDIFPNGINMVILEMMNDDITNNVNIVCPSNHYSSTLYDSYKKTIIIIKHENYYEPIYEYVLNTQINGMFSENDMNILDNLKQLLLLIKKTIIDKCAPRNSIIKSKFNFKTNILLDRLVHLLNLKNYEIMQQIINYKGKVIGILASKDGLSGMIPCYPSSPLVDLTAGYYWMDEDSYSNSYQNTLKFLKMVNNEFKNATNIIPCKPLFKIVEDGVIVGILTETNQFIKLSNPYEPEINGDELETFGELSSNYKHLDEDDKKSVSSSNIDDKRIKFINEIKLESAFFNIFRNNVRILLGDINNKSHRTTILQLISSQKYTYLEKMKIIIPILKEIMKNIVLFDKYSDNNLKNLTIKNCYMSEDCSKNPVCILNTDVSTGNTICKLKIPQNNLINNQNNELSYYSKIADELIRYTRIKSFFFKPNTFLSFTEVKYNLNDDEIIIYQSMLTQEYFKNITSSYNNKYINNNTYDTAIPKKTEWTQPYSDTVSFDTEPPIHHCNKSSPKIYNDPSIFKSIILEEEFITDKSICSFNLLIHLIYIFSNKSKKYTALELKEILLEEYSKILLKYKTELLHIFNLEGKKEIHNAIQKNENFSKIIFNEEYSATNIDIWILITFFSIPLVLLSSEPLIDIVNKNKLFVMNSPNTSGYYFIHKSGSKYKLLFNEHKEYKLILNNLTPSTKKIIEEEGKHLNILEKYFIKLKEKE